MAKKKTEEKKETQAIDLAIAAIEKAHGKGSLIYAGSEKLPDVEYKTSGCLSVDWALGGGWGRGRVVEIYGPESSGKTTLTLHAVAAAQQNGDLCAFIDMEHALDPGYAAALGVDVEKLIISQPDTGEQALQITEQLVNSGALGLIVIDSVAALVPQKEIEGEIGDSNMGLQSRLMSQAMRKLPGACNRTKTTLMFINQIRMKIGVMFGSPETTSGGNALKYYASQRVDIRRIGGVKEGSGDNAEFVANKTRVKVVKNKIGRPFRQVEVDIRYGQGIDVVADVLDLAVDRGLVEKSGAWYSHGADRIGQGRANSVEYIKQHPELYRDLWQRLQ
jgi:recombination protein RecA